MGNRRDALKHSKAVSSSTESYTPKTKDEEKKPIGEADKPEPEGIKFAYQINQLVINFQLCSLYGWATTGGLTAWLASSEGNWPMT
jgi:hypothetical protein